MSLIGKKILSLNNPGRKRLKTAGTHKTFSEAKSVGLLFSWEDKQKEETIQEFLKGIDKNKQVQCLCFNPDKKVVPDTEFLLFDTSKLTMLGKIDSPETNQFLQEPFDYLFHFDFELNDIMKSFLSRSQAHYRVGFHTEEGENYYDLMIGINKNAGLHNFASQILKYVNALK
jgi:hypothetical protein